MLCLGLGAAVAAGCSGSSGTHLTTNDAGGDAGQDDEDSGIAPGDPLGADPTCTSGKNWTLGDRGSSLMHPGDACITCHLAKNGPTFLIGGTVFPSGHEPTNCNGASGVSVGLQVIITDANGKQTSLGVNSVGNFYSYAPSEGGPDIAFPIHAKVVENGGKQRAMVDSQTTGDCNSCHTQDGANGAPGRITVPY
jgi:hypothetical protein